MKTYLIAVGLLALTLTACKDEPGPPLPFISDPLRADAGCDWPQWGQNWAHTGRSCVAAQGFGTVLGTVVFDPFVPQEVEEAAGLFGRDALFVHYASPLIVGDDVYIAVKSGTYVNCNPPGSGNPAPCGFDAWNQQTWTVKHLVLGLRRAHPAAVLRQLLEAAALAGGAGLGAGVSARRP